MRLALLSAQRPATDRMGVHPPALPALCAIVKGNWSSGLTQGVEGVGGAAATPPSMPRQASLGGCVLRASVIHQRRTPRIDNEGILNPAPLHQALTACTPPAQNMSKKKFTLICGNFKWDCCLLTKSVNQEKVPSCRGLLSLAFELFEIKRKYRRPRLRI